MVSTHVPRDGDGSSILLLQLCMLLLELDILLPQQVQVLLELGYLTWEGGWGRVGEGGGRVEGEQRGEGGRGKKEGEGRRGEGRGREEEGGEMG